MTNNFTMIENSLIKRRDLSCVEKILLIYFKTFENKINPSIAEICKRINISKTTCIRTIKGLEEKKHIKVIRSKKDSARLKNQYFLLKKIY